MKRRDIANILKHKPYIVSTRYNELYKVSWIRDRHVRVDSTGYYINILLDHVCKYDWLSEAEARVQYPEFFI